MGNTAVREFEAPGPGTWTLDTTHNSGAMTMYTSECFKGLPRGFGEGFERYGLMLNRLQPAFIHGFFFLQQVDVVGKPGAGMPPKFMMQLMGHIHPTIRKRVKSAHESFTSRLWLQDLKDWDVMKQDSIAINTRLQSVDFSQLDRGGLIEHLKACHVNAEEMVYRHHKFSVGSILPIGWFLDAATRTSGLTALEVAPLLRGSTPVSTGIAGEELKRLAKAITDEGISIGDLELDGAQQALASLREHPAIKDALDEYLVITGHMLIGGYCIAEKTLQESPNIILARIGDAMSPQVSVEFDRALEKRIRDQIPEADREEFDLSLSDARAANRMRDERGIYNDIWGSGIARMAILEAGRRLEEEGKLDNAELLLDASNREMLTMLRGEEPRMKERRRKLRKGEERRIEEPAGVSVDEATLKERREWRLNKDIDEVPEFLGTPPADPPPIEWLPAKIQPSMRAFAVVMGNVFDPPKEDNGGKISGLAVSPGVYEGIAKVILSTRDFDRLNQGDVLITKNTSAGFNVVLPIIGALVTDRGGILSHAAIVSREYGIPGVVATKTATQLIEEGSRVRVDGNTGEVTVLS